MPSNHRKRRNDHIVSHLNLLAPSDRHRADHGDDDEQESQPEREPVDAGTPAPSVIGRDLSEASRGCGGRAAAAPASGVRRQWVAAGGASLARAATPLVDERTACLDEFGEMVLMDAMRKVARECALLVAAHHMAAVRAADRVVVLDVRNILADSRREDLVHTNSSPPAFTMGRLHSRAELRETELGSNDCHAMYVISYFE